MVYKGYLAVVTKDEEIGTYTGSVNMPDGKLVFESDSKPGLEQEFQIAVDAYEAHKVTHGEWQE